MSWPTKAIYWYVATKVCDAKFAMCTEHTSNSNFGAVILACHGQAPPRSSPFSKTRKDSSSTRQQETRVTFSTDLCVRNQTSNKHDEKELLHCTSLGYRDIQCTHSHPEHHPMPVSLEPELDPVHTQQCCDYSLSQAAEQSGESHQVLTELHGYDMEGKRRRIASFDDTGGPTAPLRSNFDDPEAFSEEECSQQDVVQHMVLFLGAQSSCVVLWVVLGLVRCLRWNMGTELGRSQLHVKSVGGFSRARTVGTSLLSRLGGQVWFPGVTHRAIKQCPKVWRKSWRIARNLIRFGTIRRVNSLGIEWERQCQPLWAPVRPASRCCTLLVK